jgi:transposase-like protein
VAVAKITNDLDVLLAFYDLPGEHWIDLRTTNPIESTLATVRLRQRVRAGAKFENGVLVERPDESTSGDTHAA